jgi:hypothetical protein
MKLKVPPVVFTEQYLQDNSKAVRLTEISNKQHQILREYCNNICSDCGLESSLSLEELKDHFIDETLFQESMKILESSWKNDQNNSYSTDIKYVCDLVYDETFHESLVVPWMREFCVSITINDFDIVQKITFEEDKISSIKTYTCMKN